MRLNILLCLIIAGLIFSFIGCDSENGEPDGDLVESDRDDIVDGDLIDSDLVDGDDSETDLSDGDADTDIEIEIEDDDDSVFIPCEKWDDCDAASMGCETVTCDFSKGRCRCICSDNDDCEDETCYSGYCVGCATDSDCRDLDCTSASGKAPKCQVATETCICGGKCGDDICDEAEEVLGTCPKDCKTCKTGSVKAFSCQSGQQVVWCECKNSEWDCIENPSGLCSEPTECGKKGGQCTSDLEYCEGHGASETFGCEGIEDICCLPDECLGAGETYYPIFGICCAGLVTIDSNGLMENWGDENPGVICMANCWSQTCAPCGDGVCQPHYSENPCNCPEDCSQPPYTLVCNEQDRECGTEYCLQDGNDCIQKTPHCNVDTCSWSSERYAGQVCNSIKRKCVAP